MHWIQLQVAIITTVSSKNLQKRSYDNLDGSRASNHASNFHNIHDTQFCTDVSSWGPVEWVGEQTRKCNTTFVKEKKERSETVCISNQFFRVFMGAFLSLLSLFIIIKSKMFYSYRFATPSQSCFVTSFHTQNVN